MSAKILILITVACLVVIATGAGMALFVRGGLLHSGSLTLQDLILSREPTIWPSVGWSIAGLGATGLVGVIAARIAKGSVGDLLPKRRWFQFSLSGDDAVRGVARMVEELSALRATGRRTSQ